MWPDESGTMIITAGAYCRGKMPPASGLSLDNYDLPFLVGASRGIQSLCCIIELLMIYSESGSLSMFAFLCYSILCGFALFHLSRRWYYNIDGRYDLKQFIRESEPTVRVQYGFGECISATISQARSTATWLDFR
ncbi:hypothetical protein OSTOST_10040 [Ostertagia ostertagi]